MREVVVVVEWMVCPGRRVISESQWLYR